MKLADEVEELFIKNFAEDNRRKAMKYLKPIQREESHTVTFFIGELLLLDQTNIWTFLTSTFLVLSFASQSFWLRTLRLFAL